MGKKNLTRKDLTESVADQLGYSQVSCSEIVDCFFDSLKSSLIAGEEIKVIHFGSFTLRNKNPRTGRNPKTGEQITIKKRKMVSFRPSKKLRDLVNG
ncbi:MAG: integration host factor subunit alpha [Deltaproteobacteria bacterium]|nr:MAG: integration host factor subunit alpha [Deltaproteobacteria bacterium]